MRVLTVRQPWAWAIIHGGKDVENRTQSLGPYRGLVAIHVGLAMDLHAAALWPAGVPFDLGRYGRDTGGRNGHIVGVVDLVDTHHDQSIQGDRHCCSDGVWHGGPCAGPCSPWAMPGHHHLVLANPRPLAHPIPAKGRLSLWTPDAQLEAAIREQIGGVL